MRCATSALWSVLFVGCAAPPAFVGGERHLLWTARLGDMSYGTPVVDDGVVWIGTNNHAPRDPAATGDAGVLMAFRESDGLFLGQHVSPRLKDAMIRDWPSGSVRGAPRIEGNLLWYLNNRWEVVCLDIAPLKRGPGEPRVLWTTDLVAAAGVAPVGCAMGWGPGASVAGPYRGHVFVSTGNGIDWDTDKPARPSAPALVCLDAATGRVVAREQAGISARTCFAEWASPVLATASDGRTRLLYGGGDGFLYAFDPQPQSGLLRELWHADCNPPERDVRHGIVVAPAVQGDRVYAVLGTDIDSVKPGALVCVNLTDGRRVWSFDQVSVSIASPLVRDGTVYVAARDGLLYAVDATTGQLRWSHDALAGLLGCLGWIGDRLCLGTEEGEVLLFDVRALEAAPRSEALSVRKGDAQVHDFFEFPAAPPAQARDAVFLAVMDELYAIRNFGASGMGWAETRPRPAPDALFVPTPQDVVQAMLDAANVGPQDVVYDLGSGDGRIVAAAARRGARAVGVEIDPRLVERSRERLRDEGLADRARVESGDLLDAEFTEATVVTLYVGERLNRMLSAKLRTLKPGTRIVSHEFGMGTWRPAKSLRVVSSEDGRPHRIHLWTLPAPK